MQVYLGIDWSQNKHDMAILNEAGAVIAQQTIGHSQDGFLKLDWSRKGLGVAPSDCLVGLETAHNLLIEFLWAHGYSQVYVIPPHVVKRIRGRYGHAGARTDQSDAILLADLLRTDRARLQPWHSDSVLTRQMRVKVSLLAFLTRNTVALSVQILPPGCELDRVQESGYTAALLHMPALTCAGRFAPPTPPERRRDLRPMAGPVAARRLHGFKTLYLPGPAFRSSRPGRLQLGSHARAHGHDAAYDCPQHC